MGATQKRCERSVSGGAGVRREQPKMRSNEAVKGGHYRTSGRLREEQRTTRVTDLPSGTQSQGNVRCPFPVRPNLAIAIRNRASVAGLPAFAHPEKSS